MILSRPDIIQYLKDRKLKIKPDVKRDQIAQVSIDLRLGRKFSVFKDPPQYLTAIRVDPSLYDSEDIWQHYEQDTFLLDPGQFVLAQTLESVCIPEDLIGLVEGRSSWARVGVTIHVTSPKIDPGFNAPITLEMANFGRITMELRAKIDKPAQLMLLQISTPLSKEDLYGTSAQDIFQGQKDPIPHKRKKRAARS